MQRFSSFQTAVLAVLCLGVGAAVYGLPRDETVDAIRVAEVRKQALQRSMSWVKQDDIKSSKIASANDDETALKLLEEARTPDLTEIIAADPLLDADALKRAANLDYTKTGSITMVTPKRLTGFRPGLENFHAKLDALDAKTRRRPVAVLHLGGSHVAADGFSRGIREDLQKRYGDSGRGMVQPAGFSDAAVADQMTMAISGKWTRRHAMKQKHGRFGVSGMSVSSSDKEASLRLTKQNGPFDWASVTIATGPDQGKVRLKVGAREKVYSATAQRPGSHTFRLDISGTSLTVEPAGDGETTVLNWATGKVQPGVRYVNFGLEDAGADVLDRFSAKLMEKDVRRLSPDLIIIGYGTVEGFDDDLDLPGYKSRLGKTIERLKRWAPEANLVFVGAASGLRRDETGSCNGWAVPPKLKPLRETIQSLAKEHNATYWDWSLAMGGPCAVDVWARNGLARKDRRSLTKTGYRRSARLFSQWLMRQPTDVVATVMARPSVN